MHGGIGQAALAGTGSTRSPGEAHLQAFADFVAFFQEVFRRPGFLDGVAARDSIRAYVPRYYAKTFGPEAGPLEPRHLKWFRRLRPLLSLPAGATIVDYGGGYGLDSIWLASRGYDVVFYEISLCHIAVAEHLAALWRAERGPLHLHTILRDRHGGEPFPHVDAVLLDEVAHHVEPVASVFTKCGSILEPGGRIFLLEPNAWSPVSQAYFLRVRGLATTLWLTDEKTGERYLYGNEHIRPPFVWDRIAARCGFERERRYHVVPFGLCANAPLDGPIRTAVERTPLVRALAATHVTTVYRRA